MDRVRRSFPQTSLAEAFPSIRRDLQAHANSITFTVVTGLALLWLNLYWCRDVFFLDHFGQMQSIRGFWEGLARFGHFSWQPEWWPYSYNGMPLEYTYAPGVPALIAAAHSLTGWSFGRCFGVIAGFVFCAGPLGVYWLAREATARPVWSFIAALAYSLLAPSQLLVPDQEFRFSHLGDARRFMLIFAWDEVPHQLALLLVLIAAVFVVRGLKGPKLCFWFASVFLALGMLVSAFGGTLGALFLCLIWLGWSKGNRLRQILWIAGTTIAAYLVVCPFFPPSLIAVIRRNANLSSEYGWTSRSVYAVLIAVLGTMTLTWASQRWQRWYLRLFLLLTFVFFAIPFLSRWNMHFVPQTGRYKVELDLALTLFGTFVVAIVVDRLNLLWRAALIVILLAPAAYLVKAHRIYARAVLRPSSIAETMQYNVASWLAVHMPQERVLAAGSVGFWMNEFTGQQQLSGGSFTTIPTITIQIATWGVPHLNPTAAQRDLPKLWLQGYGVDAFVVPGPASSEMYRDVIAPEQIDSLFPLLWRKDGVSIYSVPRMYRSLASVVPQNAVVKQKPDSLLATSELQRYTAAMNEPASQAEWRWLDNNRAVARGVMPAGTVLSAHVTYNPGWKAFVNNSAVTVFADGLEQIAITPNCSGACEVKLVYDGGMEAKLTRLASLAMILIGSASYFVLRARRKPKFAAAAA